VLDALRRTDEAGIERVVLEFVHHFLAFLDQPFGALALLALGGEIELLRDLLETLHVAARLFQVLLERGGELFVGGVLSHFRQRLDDLVLGAVQVLDLIFEEIVERVTIVGH
jgi:hypothetical protein